MRQFLKGIGAYICNFHHAMLQPLNEAGKTKSLTHSQTSLFQSWNRSHFFNSWPFSLITKIFYILWDLFSSKAIENVDIVHDCSFPLSSLKLSNSSLFKATEDLDTVHNCSSPLSSLKLSNSSLSVFTSNLYTFPFIPSSFKLCSTLCLERVIKAFHTSLKMIKCRTTFKKFL